MTAAVPLVVVLHVELARREIGLRAAGDRLRYRPRSTMTPDLADRPPSGDGVPPGSVNVNTVNGADDDWGEL